MTIAPGWVEIDADAIAANLSTVRAEIGSAAKLCAVVKADAYGHGIDLTLPALMAQNVSIAGITSNIEARQLRDLGFAGRILRLRAALADEIADGLDDGIEEWIGGADHARIVDHVARRFGRTISAHVSINSTGLSRDGIEASSSCSIDSIRALEALRIVGIASHFPQEDAADIEEGAAVFGRESSAVAHALESSADGTVQRHCASSHAALSVPSSRFDMVRIGAALYGDTSVLGAALVPVMRVLTRIAAVNDYAAGATVGYDRTHRLAHASRLAVLPVGYADGYRRAFSVGSGADVLIGGRRAPIVDLLAMNTCIVDVTGIPSAAIGDEVVLYGRQGSQSITSAEVQRVSGQIAADSYAAWGRLLPRVSRGLAVRSASVG